MEGEDVPAATLGRSDDIMAGEWAITIGNPLGLAIEDAQPAVAVGVVSAVGRDFRREQGSRTVYRDMIQTDATIKSGQQRRPAGERPRGGHRDQHLHTPQKAAARKG